MNIQSLVIFQSKLPSEYIFKTVLRCDHGHQWASMPINQVIALEVKKFKWFDIFQALAIWEFSTWNTVGHYLKVVTMGKVAALDQESPDSSWFVDAVAEFTVAGLAYLLTD